MKNIARVIIAVLIGVDGVAYIAAKFDFFTHYDSRTDGSYLRGHVVYWVAMLTLALLAGLIEILYPDKRDGRQV